MDAYIKYAPDIWYVLKLKWKREKAELHVHPGSSRALSKISQIEGKINW